MDERRAQFEALAMPHLDAAYSLARWLARSGADADDVVQDAMLRAYRAFDGVRGENIRAWLLAIVRNCWRNRIADGRRRGHEPLPGDDEPRVIAFEGPGPEEAAAQASDRRRLDGLIAALPEDFREVLVLREIHDLSYREIAEATGARIGTVMSRLARARGLLKDQWLAMDGGDGLR